MQEKRSCKREREICVLQRNQTWVWVCVLIKQISSTQLLVCVCVCVYWKRSWKCYKRSAPRCVRLYTCKIKGRHGCVYMCVCHHHSLINSFLCVYVCICTLTPLNDCDYIRKYLTIKYEVLCIKTGIVFPYNYTMQPSQ